jgi:hypothetical protein
MPVDPRAVDYRTRVTAVGRFPRHFQTGVNRFFGKVFEWLTDEVMKIFADNAILPCVDTIVYAIRDGKIMVLLPKRTEEPHPGVWVSSGGQRKPGRLPEEEVARHLKRDTNLVLDLLRLTYINVWELLWDTRASSAGDGGCHGITKVFGYRLNDDEFATIRLAGDNVGSDLSSSWYDADSVVSDSTGRFHPALVDMIAELLRLIRA